MTTEIPSKVRIADGVWIAVALLHNEYPERLDFSESEIQARFLSEGLPRGSHSNTLPAHIGSHCVANWPRSRKSADPTKLQGGAYRILYETRSGFRRLFRPTDDAHPDRWQSRRESKSIPVREQIPEKYHHLLDWYAGWSQAAPRAIALEDLENDPLLRLRGSGRHIWADEHADEYVENLRREPK
ncbi:MAG TPA: hypothetical protein VHX20_04120 [Terracidiphilus sp.]|jgi:hypothetical protein|nr:hypothetical protein [Terracidiphilus sp.]